MKINVIAMFIASIVVYDCNVLPLLLLLMFICIATIVINVIFIVKICDSLLLLFLIASIVVVYDCNLLPCVVAINVYLYGYYCY